MDLMSFCEQPCMSPHTNKNHSLNLPESKQSINQIEMNPREPMKACKCGENGLQRRLHYIHTSGSQWLHQQQQREHMSQLNQVVGGATHISQNTQEEGSTMGKVHIKGLWEIPHLLSRDQSRSACRLMQLLQGARPQVRNAPLGLFA